MPIPEFTDSQWDFLSTIQALGGSAAVDIIGALAPLTPGPFMDLVRRGKQAGILIEPDDQSLALASAIDPEIMSRIKAPLTPERIRQIADQVDSLGLSDRLDVKSLAGLLNDAGRAYEAAVLEKEKGREAIQRGDFEQGLNHLQQAVDRLAGLSKDPRSASLLVSTAVELVQLKFLLGHQVNQVPSFLKKVGNVAGRIGDRRSQTLIGLYFATFYYLNNQLSDALDTLSSELKQVRELGDEDILEQSAEYFGLYYYLKGMHREAADYFERTLELAATRGENDLYWPVQVYLGFSSACLGRFHRAIGLLDANRRRAIQRSENSLACYFRAILGVVLLMMNKSSEASYHLHGARSEAITYNNILARNVCELSLAFKDHREGRIQEAYEMTKTMFAGLSDHGLRIRQYPTPLLLELLFAFHQNGFPPLAEVNFETELNRLLAGPNYHLKGVALRIKALGSPDPGAAPEDVLNDLCESEACLIRSGDPIELARTRVAMIRQLLAQGNKGQAESLALKAWEGLSGHRSDYFPDDLRFLLDNKGIQDQPDQTPEDILQRLFDLVNQLAPSPNLDELLGRLVKALNQFFRSERGGLFWFSKDKRKRPELRASRNLSREEVYSKNFRPNLTQVFKSFREQRPVLVQSERKPPRPVGDQTLTIICLPIEFKGKIQGVLYHDSSYLDQHAGFLNNVVLSKLTTQIGAYLEHIFDYGNLREERDRLVSARQLSLEEAGAGRILTQSPNMIRLLADADRAAATESTVLITGETGVGKELLAQRIHTRSPRASGPFIVVDLASTPENLVESELFGHEKGAFTGADRQRIGRLELAHQGTLFIDELGEIPLSIQVKLLRVLQEKSFYRVGGGRSISSDFRLVAATNRNLEREVAAGRFRQDLFYRLNVIPLHLPPLKDRPGDPVFLAEHFMQTFANRFNRPPMALKSDIQNKLAAYSWPGNIRELKNVIERAVLLSDGDILALDLPESGSTAPNGLIDDSPTLDELQRRYIRMVLDKTGGRIGGPGGAAETLGMKRTSLYARMKNLGLR